MSTFVTPPTEKWSRVALLVEGLAAAAFGIAVLVWPTKTAVALTGVIAVWAIVGGIVYVVMGFVSKHLGTGGRVGHILLGILYVVAGIYAFSSLARTAAFLAVFLVIMVGVMWMMEGFTALFTLGGSGSKAITVVFAIISILAGFSLLTSPLWGAVFLWWFLGIGLAVLGVLNIVRAIIGRKN
ncbi:Uncharacterized membrane protein HdeD, DUF308 family [Tessaracoccus bendigoensis DSM 12906]|uniref:Uncharacterized membrane protein HdeD, DUF308 family n=1 Tax=Tessaracoccus bendigoensis DSM 12906 TaxID=1123357 RepID=A0A1M6GNV4_9ACTN|nr:DUF308 domain-containing protein [Tessaracoccus bendigoensis]SHJ11603.1 Uncharacterized membrane protein HdeD, DUF308 family [Tessaracoccus bendigoensis DSM 12906]